LIWVSHFGAHFLTKICRICLRRRPSACPHPSGHVGLPRDSGLLGRLWRSSSLWASRIYCWANHDSSASLYSSPFH